MNAHSRFDLEVAIATWRRFLLSERSITAEDADELESHLRDEIDERVAVGLEPDAAFKQAVRRLGDYALLERSYRRVYWKKLREEHRIANELQWRGAMLKNYFVTALRHVRRNKGYAAINIFGLAVGMACFLLITLYINYEFSYDRFHESSDRIFRVVLDHERAGTVRHSTGTPLPLAPAIEQQISQVLHAVRLYPASQVSIARKDQRFAEDRVLFVDSSFFDVFSFSLKRGDPKKALARPGTIVLTPAMVKKYFGDADPLGKTLTLEGEMTVEVTGVLTPMPSNTHLHFDFLVSFVSLGVDETNPSRWRNQYNYYTYLLLASEQDLANVQSQAEALLAERAQSAVVMQRIDRIHLHSHRESEIEPGGSATVVYILAMIALLILSIASINFINLSTSRAVQRAREVGVRKVQVDAVNRRRKPCWPSEPNLRSSCSGLTASTCTRTESPR